MTGSIGANPSPARRAPQQVVFPTINRTNKGDRLVPSAPPRAGAERATTTTRRRRRAEAHDPAEPARSAEPARRAAEIDHTDSELPDAQAVVLAEIAREAQRRNAPGREAGRDRGRDAFRAVRRIRHFALARARSEDRDRRAGRSRRPRSDRVHAERAAEPRRAERRGEGDAALFRQRPVRHQPRRHPALGERRGAGADAAPIRT